MGEIFCPFLGKIFKFWGWKKFRRLQKGVSHVFSTEKGVDTFWEELRLLVGVLGDTRFARIDVSKIFGGSKFLIFCRFWAIIRGIFALKSKNAVLRTKVRKNLV